MSAQFLPAAIMFLITVAIGALFWLPAIKVVQKCSIIKFYWMGFWAFLGGIVALSGAQSVLVILGQDVERFASAMLVGVSAAFVLFVVFAWGRLSLRGANHLFTKGKSEKFAKD